MSKLEASGAQPPPARSTGDGTLRGTAPSNETRVAELEAQLAETLSTQNMEVGFYKCWYLRSMYICEMR